MRKQYWTVSAIATLAILASAPAIASEMVYHPVNPTFGGNPLNGSFLLQQAQAQGEGVKSGSQGPDLSGLSNALNGLGSGSSPIIISPASGNGGSNNNSGTNNVTPP
jgi:curli production assembly/transport component CsgF